MPDFIQPPDSAFNTQQQAMVAAIVANPGNYSLTSAQVTNLQTKSTAFGAAYADYIAKGNAAAAATVTKVDARDDLEEAIREINTLIQADSTVTDAAKEAAGFPVHKEGRTPSPVPGTRPQLSIDNSQRCCQTVHFRDEGSTNRAKPAGVKACELYVFVGTAPPASLSEFRFVTQDSRSPYLLTYDSADAGKNAYWIGRWINPTGEAGPWSETVMATIGA